MSKYDKPPPYWKWEDLTNHPFYDYRGLDGYRWIGDPYLYMWKGSGTDINNVEWRPGISEVDKNRARAVFNALSEDLKEALKAATGAVVRAVDKVKTVLNNPATTEAGRKATQANGEAGTVDENDYSAVASIAKTAASIAADALRALADYPVASAIKTAEAHARDARQAETFASNASADASADAGGDESRAEASARAAIAAAKKAAAVVEAAASGAKAARENDQKARAGMTLKEFRERVQKEFDYDIMYRAAVIFGETSKVAYTFQQFDYSKMEPPIKGSGLRGIATYDRLMGCYLRAARVKNEIQNRLDAEDDADFAQKQAEYRNLWQAYFTNKSLPTGSFVTNNNINDLLVQGTGWYTEEEIISGIEGEFVSDEVDWLLKNNTGYRVYEQETEDDGVWYLEMGKKWSKAQQSSTQWFLCKRFSAPEQSDIVAAIEEDMRNPALPELDESYRRRRSYKSTKEWNQFVNDQTFDEKAYLKERCLPVYVELKFKEEIFAIAYSMYLDTNTVDEGLKALKGKNEGTGPNAAKKGQLKKLGIDLENETTIRQNLEMLKTWQEKPYIQKFETIAEEDEEDKVDRLFQESINDAEFMTITNPDIKALIGWDENALFSRSLLTPPQSEPRGDVPWMEKLSGKIKTWREKYMKAMLYKTVLQDEFEIFSDQTSWSAPLRSLYATRVKSVMTSKIPKFLIFQEDEYKIIEKDAELKTAWTDDRQAIANKLSMDVMDVDSPTTDKNILNQFRELIENGKFPEVLFPKLEDDEEAKQVFEEGVQNLVLQISALEMFKNVFKITTGAGFIEGKLTGTTISFLDISEQNKLVEYYKRVNNIRKLVYAFDEQNEYFTNQLLNSGIKKQFVDIIGPYLHENLRSFIVSYETKDYSFSHQLLYYLLEIQERAKLPEDFKNFAEYKFDTKVENFISKNILQTYNLQWETSWKLLTKMQTQREKLEQARRSVDSLPASDKRRLASQIQDAQSENFENKMTALDRIIEEAQEIRKAQNTGQGGTAQDTQKISPREYIETFLKAVIEGKREDVLDADIKDKPGDIKNMAVSMDNKVGILFDANNDLTAAGKDLKEYLEKLTDTTTTPFGIASDTVDKLEEANQALQDELAQKGQSWEAEKQELEGKVSLCEVEKIALTKTVTKKGRKISELEDKRQRLEEVIQQVKEISALDKKREEIMNKFLQTTDNVNVAGRTAQNELKLIKISSPILQDNEDLVTELEQRIENNVAYIEKVIMENQSKEKNKIRAEQTVQNAQDVMNRLGNPSADESDPNKNTDALTKVKADLETFRNANLDEEDKDKVRAALTAVETKLEQEKEGLRGLLRKKLEEFEESVETAETKLTEANTNLADRAVNEAKTAVDATKKSGGEFMKMLGKLTTVANEFDTQRQDVETKMKALTTQLSALQQTLADAVAAKAEAERRAAEAKAKAAEDEAARKAAEAKTAAEEAKKEADKAKAKYMASGESEDAKEWKEKAEKAKTQAESAAKAATGAYEEGSEAEAAQAALSRAIGENQQASDEEKNLRAAEDAVKNGQSGDNIDDAIGKINGLKGKAKSRLTGVILPTILGLISFNNTAALLDAAQKLKGDEDDADDADNADAANLVTLLTAVKAIESGKTETVDDVLEQKWKVLIQKSNDAKKKMKERAMKRALEAAEGSNEENSNNTTQRIKSSNFYASLVNLTEAENEIRRAYTGFARSNNGFFQRVTNAANKFKNDSSGITKNTIMTINEYFKTAKTTLESLRNKGKQENIKIEKEDDYMKLLEELYTTGGQEEDVLGAVRIALGDDQVSALNVQIAADAAVDNDGGRQGKETPMQNAAGKTSGDDAGGKTGDNDAAGADAKLKIDVNRDLEEEAKKLEEIYDKNNKKNSNLENAMEIHFIYRDRESTAEVSAVKVACIFLKNQGTIKLDAYGTAVPSYINNGFKIQGTYSSGTINMWKDVSEEKDIDILKDVTVKAITIPEIERYRNEQVENLMEGESLLKEEEEDQFDDNLDNKRFQTYNTFAKDQTVKDINREQFANFVLYEHYKMNEFKNRYAANLIKDVNLRKGKKSYEFLYQGQPFFHLTLKKNNQKSSAIQKQMEKEVKHINEYKSTGQSEDGTNMGSGTGDSAKDADQGAVGKFSEKDMFNESYMKDDTAWLVRDDEYTYEIYLKYSWRKQILQKYDIKTNKWNTLKTQKLKDDQKWILVEEEKRVKGVNLDEERPRIAEKLKKIKGEKEAERAKEAKRTPDGSDVNDTRDAGGEGDVDGSGDGDAKVELREDTKERLKNLNKKLEKFVSDEPSIKTNRDAEVFDLLKKDEDISNEFVLKKAESNDENGVGVYKSTATLDEASALLEDVVVKNVFQWRRQDNKIMINDQYPEKEANVALYTIQERKYKPMKYLKEKNKAEEMKIKNNLPILAEVAKSYVYHALVGSKDNSWYKNKNNGRYMKFVTLRQKKREEWGNDLVEPVLNKLKADVRNSVADEKDSLIIAFTIIMKYNITILDSVADAKEVLNGIVEEAKKTKPGRFVQDL